MKSYKKLIIGLLLIIIVQPVKAQEKQGVPAGHNVVTINHRQVDAVNRDAQYTDWLKAIIKIFDGSLDTRHIGVQMNVEDNFDDSFITGTTIGQRTADFLNYLNSIGADPYVCHTLLGDENMANNIAYNLSPSVLSASYLTPNALNMSTILFHEAIGHGSMAGNNSDHNSGKAALVEENVGTESNPNWVTYGNIKTAMSAGDTGGLYAQVATTNPAKSTGSNNPGDWLYFPSPLNGAPNRFRIHKDQAGHSNPALNTLTIINDHFIDYPQKITNLGDAETVTPPTYNVDTNAGTITITNPASDYSGSLEIITGTGITSPDNYSLHFYDANGVLINPNGDVGYRFKPLYAGQPNPAVAYPANAAFIAILNDDQNVKSVLVPFSTADTEAPVISTNPYTVYLDASGNATWSFSDFDNGTSDNSGNWTVTSFSPSNVDCSNIGTVTVSFTIEDADGNQSNGTETGTVIDNINPVAQTQNITVDIQNGAQTITANMIDNGSTDNCGVANMSIDLDYFDTVGTFNGTFTATDSSNNSDTETYTVEVINSLAINEQEIAGFNVYPNPSTAILTIKATENIEKVILYNPLGQIVLEKQINANKTELNIKKLTNGIYILKTFGENAIGIRQIIKE